MAREDFQRPYSRRWCMHVGRVDATELFRARKWRIWLGVVGEYPAIEWQPQLGIREFTYLWRVRHHCYNMRDGQGQER